MNKQLSIIIPVYNSESTIGTLTESIVSLYKDRYTLQVVLINDGSRDGSDGICRALSDKYPEAITYLQLSRNFGEHNAVMAGLHHARGRFCVIMDDDLQNPPEAIEKLIAPLMEGQDAVYAKYSDRSYGVLRNLGSAFHDYTSAVFLRKPRDLTLSSFKAISAFLVKEIIKYTGPYPYIDAIILRSTERITSVEVPHLPESRKSNYTFHKLMAMWGNVVVNFSLLPIRLIGFVGLVMVLMGLAGIFTSKPWIIFIESMVENLGNDSTLISFMFLLRGISLMALSLVGEYVGRIYVQQNKAPQFIVREALDRGSSGPG